MVLQAVVLRNHSFTHHTHNTHTLSHTQHTHTRTHNTGGKAGGSKASSGDASSSAAAEALYRVPEFASFGPLFRSTKAVELTEAELEYLVSVTKHVFGEVRHAIASVLHLPIMRVFARLRGAVCT